MCHFDLVKEIDLHVFYDAMNVALLERDMERGRSAEIEKKTEMWALSIEACSVHNTYLNSFFFRNVTILYTICNIYIRK